MDNVLKIMVGVLGLFALVILAIPSPQPDQENVVKPIAAPMTTPQPSVSPKEIPDEDQSDEKPTKDEDWADDEYESFGQPMNDAKPLGVSDDDQNKSDPVGQAGYPPMQANGGAVVTPGNNTKFDTQDASNRDY